MSNYETTLVKATNTYLPMITSTLEHNQIEMTSYQKQCVMAAIGHISNALEAKQKSFSDVDSRSLTEALTLTATLQLNPSASPREIYYIIRNKKVGNEWVSVVETGIEGDGNDSLLARFGRDVKTVHKYWEVRENDEFEYPEFVGLELTPPKWKPKGTGKVVRIVYPITKTNGEVEYLIAERSDVVRNLIAHIKNNLMNETFGIAKDRYNATEAQRKQIDEKKNEIIERLKNKSIEEILDDAALANYISPAWKDEQSSEAMIIRKMRNNITKKYPKNFENAFLERVYNESTDENLKSMRKDVTENANQELLDFPESTPTRADVDTETGEIIKEYAEFQEVTESESTDEVEQVDLLDPGF